MKKNYLTLIITAFILFVAIFTNPKLDQHKEVVKTELNTYMQQSMAESGTKAGGQAFGALLGGMFIDKIIDSIVSSDNYLVFSLTKVTWEGKSRVIGFGVFGNVYITGEVKKALSQATKQE